METGRRCVPVRRCVCVPTCVVCLSVCLHSLQCLVLDQCVCETLLTLYINLYSQSLERELHAEVTSHRSRLVTNPLRPTHRTSQSCIRVITLITLIRELCLPLAPHSHPLIRDCRCDYASRYRCIHAYCFHFHIQFHNIPDWGHILLPIHSFRV
jgi:hypothetical protein